MSNSQSHSDLLPAGVIYSGVKDGGGVHALRCRQGLDPSLKP